MPESPELAPLLPRIASGDRDAVRLCLERYRGLVYTLAVRFLGDRTEAEDATQDVFLELWRSAGRYDAGSGREITFITMITRRRLIDRRRRLGSRTMEPLPELVAPVLSVVDSCDESQQIRTALHELRPDERQALLLAIDQGLSHAEIAKHLNQPLGTVKSQIRRAILAVRERLMGSRISKGDRS